MPYSPQRLYTSLCVSIVGLAMMVAPSSAAAQKSASGKAPSTTRRIQKIVDALRKEMAVPHAVKVELVVTNPLKASVEPMKGAVRTFRLSIEQGFLEQLSQDEVRAVIAHELGHVWIYTHHPYLQTEQLANQIAMRVVKRESIAKVYSKVWEHGGAPGPLPRFPEERETPAGLGAPARQK
jgi:uncharacterized protein YjaZ